MTKIKIIEIKNALKEIVFFIQFGWTGSFVFSVFDFWGFCNRFILKVGTIMDYILPAGQLTCIIKTAMDIYWYGQAMFKLKGKTATVVIDPFSPEIGLKFPKVAEIEAQVVLSTHNHTDHNNISQVPGDPLQVTGPGEYEVSGVSITGTEVFHDNSNGSERGTNTIYNVLMDGVNIVHLGDLGHVLSEDQSARIDNCDILLIPVGGVYTIDGETAAKVVAQLEPKVVIPMHYKLEGLQFNLSGVEEFLKQMGKENIAPQPKFSITKDKLPDETEVVLLSKS
ncbi:MBL fold metallo-hydrolase [Candidatus Daviesbacteria bacterium]|nr:MBL fold metallo-hydrolase [Candidatus Daviesbacteria bacterium]